MVQRDWSLDSQQHARSLTGLTDEFQDLLRLMHGATSVRHQEGGGAPPCTAFNFMNDLPIIHLDHHESSCLFGKLAQPLFRERPDHNRTKQPGTQSFLTSHFDGSLDDAPGDAISHKDNLSILRSLLLIADNFRCIQPDLVNQALKEGSLGAPVHGRITFFIMRQAGDVNAITLAGSYHLGHSIRTRLEGLILGWRQGSVATRDNFDLLRRGNNDFLRHMADALVHHEHHWGSVLLRKVESIDHQVKAFLG